jgi:hypothetical protein
MMSVEVPEGLRCQGPVLELAGVVLENSVGLQNLH